MTSRDPSLPDILAVDDTPANLQLLVDLLSERGHRVRPVTSGEMAMRALSASKPDLVLLDVNMPGISGYEVCKRMKENEETRDIPVIFLSALDEPSVKVLAFKCGGVDYITKPFQVDEVVARVATHLELRNQRKRLQEQNQKLCEMEQLRDSLVHMIVHDMRSPLLAISLNLELLAQSSLADPEDLRMVADARKCTLALVQMAEQMLDVSRLEAHAMPLDKRDTDLTALVESVIQDFGSTLADRRVAVHARSAVMASCDGALIRRVTCNLMSNAVKYTRSGGSIQVRIHALQTEVRVEVEDDGVGIPEDKLPGLFEKFSQASNQDARRGHGLGLAFVRLVAEAHGGNVGVTSTVGKGTRLWFSLPTVNVQPSLATPTL
ncbi:MAG: hybrid sensor histidine kinase/response regulator [Opitutaceae bacterium]|nr:hybrid sensor histidine kinase/response regulator [Opitutaceae bacterium]